MGLSVNIDKDPLARDALTAWTIAALISLAGCAPDVQQAVRQAQRREVMAVAELCGISAKSMIETAARPEDPETPEALQALEEALVGERRRLNAVAVSRGDDEFVQTVADLCTPGGLNDVRTVAYVFGRIAASAPLQAVLADPARMSEFRRDN